MEKSFIPKEKTECSAEYIFLTGAPGSKWSAVYKYLYWSPSVNHSDYTREREYFGPFTYPMHTGAYWDPGMEFDIGEWDKPFTRDDGIKLVKSHQIACNLDEYKDYPIVLVLKDDQECVNWWFQAGGFDIPYPNYKPFYKNREVMIKRVKEQNNSIRKFIAENDCIRVDNDLSELNDIIGINKTPTNNPMYPEERLESGLEFKHLQGENPIEVYVYYPPSLHT